MEIDIRKTMDSDDDIFPSEDSDLDSEDQDPDDEPYIFADPDTGECQPLVRKRGHCLIIDLLFFITADSVVK